MKKKTKHPCKYLKYKGCFGSPLGKGRYRPDRIELGRYLCIYDDDDFKVMDDGLNKVLKNPDLELDLKEVVGITIRGALILKAFFDEFSILHNKRPRLRGPRSEKMRAVLNYLGIGRYRDVEKLHFRDIDCWQIFSWDHTQADIQFPKLLHEEIIPKCWTKDHSITEHSASIATSVAEALLNCKEHAYTGTKESSQFKRWYLGVGEYPETRQFAFCVYDKGVGIKARLREKPTGWFHDKIIDGTRSDSAMIELATKGRSGSPEDTGGRGQGLKSAIDLLASNSGTIDIYSDRGFYSNSDERNGKDRRSSLEGTMVAFSFPLEYREESA